MAFETQQELDDYLHMREEAIKRDHRKIGKELGLFVFSDLVGPGLPLYTHHGMTILSALKNYSRELRTKMGYQEVQTPQINKAALFHTSGHYDKYKQDMFRVVSNYTDEEYYLKPMNCPQHTQLYASRMRSYKDLPVRIADFSLLYRDEKPGELSGLTRLRSFSQDDSHCFCREDQIEHECSLLLNAIQEAMQTYGMNYSIRLSLRDESQKEKYLGDDKIWETSQNALRSMLKQSGINYEEAPGEAAFYGPKMDLLAHDALGRTWQLSTIQLDMNMPERFGLEYIDEDGSQKTPLMIHSALVGSPERFFGILIEHHAGAFPVWLSPVQVAILPVSEKFLDNARKLSLHMQSTSIRVEIDESNESVGKKIRNAETSKIPYMLVLGEKEAQSDTLAVRKRGSKETIPLSRDEFCAMIQEKIRTKSLEV